MINPLFKHYTRYMSYHNALEWDQIPKSKSKITCEVDNLWERDFAKSPVSHLIRKNFQLTFERNPKFFWFFYTLRYDWSEKLAPLSRPIILKTIANLVLISRVSRAWNNLPVLFALTLVFDTRSKSTSILCWFRPITNVFSFVHRTLKRIHPVKKGIMTNDYKLCRYSYIVRGWGNTERWNCLAREKKSRGTLESIILVRNLEIISNEGK